MTMAISGSIVGPTADDPGKPSGLLALLSKKVVHAGARPGTAVCEACGNRRPARMNRHKNARITPYGRALMVRRVRELGRSAARAVVWFARPGICVRRVMTANGTGWRSHLFRRARAALGLRHLRTRPYTPKTNQGRALQQDHARGLGLRPCPTALRRTAAASCRSGSPTTITSAPMAASPAARPPHASQHR